MDIKLLGDQVKLRLRDAVRSAGESDNWHDLTYEIADCAIGTAARCSSRYTLIEVREFLEDSSVWDSEFLRTRKALLLHQFDEKFEH